MEQENLNDSIHEKTEPDTPATVKERIDETIGKLVKGMRWDFVWILAFMALWMLNNNNFGQFKAYEFILMIVFLIVIIFIDAIELFKALKLKKAASYQERLAIITYLKKSESLVKWLIIAYLLFFFLQYVLTDSTAGLFGMLIDVVMFLAFILLCLLLFHLSSKHKRIKQLEDDLSQLSEKEKE